MKKKEILLIKMMQVNNCQILLLFFMWFLCDTSDFSLCNFYKNTSHLCNLDRQLVCLYIN